MQPGIDWQENVAPDEKERFEEYGRFFARLQERRDAGGPMRRGLHVKPHVGVRARLTTLGDVPAPYRAGIFGAAGEYDAWVRFSNGGERVRNDHASDVRGLAFKVLGVPGKKLIPGMQDAVTQDFLLIQLKTFGFRDSDEFMYVVGAARQPLLLLPRLLARFRLRTFPLMAGLLRATGRRIESLAVERFFGPAPIRWGDYAAKVSAIPLSQPAQLPRSGSRDYLRDELVARLAREPIEYDFAVQLYVDPIRTPIEDGSVDWREEDAPFVKVARLTIPQQDLTGDAGRRQMEYVERLSFDPWHAPVEFRPLGDIMRARNEAYRVSSMARKAEPGRRDRPRGGESDHDPDTPDPHRMRLARAARGGGRLRRLRRGRAEPPCCQITMSPTLTWPRTTPRQ
jgi:hypothetical protein